MTIFLLKTILIVILSLIFVQDIKSRTVHILLLLALGMMAFIIYGKSSYSAFDLLLSYLFLCLTVTGLWLYLFIRKKNIKNAIGVGDLIFLLMIIPLFSFVSYMYFYITGLLFSTLAHVFLLKQNISETIPLAGFLSTYIIILITLELITQINIFHYN